MNGHAPDEPSYRALPPDLEARMKARRAAARRRGDRSATPPRPKVFGAWNLVEEIGEGPAGKVWRAQGPASGADVAIKILRTAVVQGDEVPGGRQTSARREGRLFATASHPHLVDVHGVEEHDGVVGIVMEFLEAPTLDERIRQGGALPFRAAMELGAELCEGLEVLHGMGLAHGDVKPRNVVLCRGRGAVLMDPATVRALPAPPTDRAIALSGTPLTMAPERLDGAPPTPSADLYSLGAVLFQALTRRYPVQGPLVKQLRAAHAEGRRPGLDSAGLELPAAVVAVVERALAADPRARFATAAAMGEALRRARDVDLETERRAEATGIARLWWSMPLPARRAAVVAALGALLVLLWWRSR